MKRIYKNIISLLLATAMLSGTLPALGAIDVSFKKRADGKAEATITGATDVNKVAIAQYDEAGFLINFGISALSGASAVTIADYYANPSYKTKLIPFSNFETLDTQRKGYLVGERTVAEEKFDTAHNMQIARYENTMEIVPDAGVDGSGALHIKRTAGSTSGGHATLNGILSETSDFIVYEFDIKANTANTHNRVQIRGVTDAGATGIEPMIFSMHPNEEEGATTLQVTLGSNRTITSTSTNVCTIDVGVYYHLSVVVNYVDHIAKYVFSETDGDIILSMTEPIDPKIGYGAGQDKPYGIRIYAPNSYWRPMHLDFDFYVDNLRVYEGTHPVSDLGDVVYVIDTKSTETVFESDEPYKEKLADTYSLHTRSGIAYLNGEKTELRNKPYSKNGEIYVPLSELETAWMIQSEVAAGNDGYCKLSDLAQSLGLNLYIDTNATYNNGLAVIGEDFTFPTGEELQKLNDFAFYMRPTADEVRAVFNARGNSHPRVMADKATFDKIKAQYVDRTNTTFNKWASKVITYANNMLNLSKGGASFQQRWGYKYDSGRISGVGNCSWGAFVLAMAYNLTGETRYTDKLYEILETVGEYPNWNPNHHLDAPQIALGFAIAYDWCYDVWKPEQKAFMSKTVHDKLFYESALAYQSTGAKMNNFAVVSGNHNSVCNGGIAASAIAFMDVYPEECAYLLKNAVRGIENSMWNWAPSGSWYEGTGYWNFAMEFTVYMLSSLDVTFGTTYGLENCEGLKTAPEFTINSQTQNGPHNYSDCGVHGENKDLYSPEMLWISQKFGIPEITQTVIMRMPEKLNQEEDTVLGLLWYDTSILDGDTTMPIDAIYDKDNVITMRNNWKQDETSSFVGIHGGKTNVEHSQIDGGSFVFEQGGVRWAIDPGLDNYYVPNYWVTNYSSSAANRWRYFRSMAAAHNTIEIEPDPSYTGHDLDSRVEVDLVATGKNGAIATADMTDALNRHAEQATRGFYYTDNRESLVIRDEIKFKEEIDNSKYIVNENFDNITETDLLGTNGSGAIVAGNVANLSADNKVLSLTDGTAGTNQIAKSFFNNANWGDNTGLKVATLEFDYYTTNSWDDFYVYPTAYNRYGMRMEKNEANDVKGMSPGWTKVSTGVAATRYQWHHFALEYNMTTGVFKLYKGDDVIYQTTGLATNGFVPSDFNVRCSTGNGSTYIDNIKFYEGTYGADLIKDETPAEEFDVMWYLMTGEDNDNKWANYDDIDVAIADDGKSAILTHRLTGKQMKLEYVVDGGTAELTTAAAETIRQQLITDGFIYDTTGLSSTYQSYTEPHKNRITLKVTGSGEVAITVKLTPVGLEGATPITNYNKPISQWTL